PFWRPVRLMNIHSPHSGHFMRLTVIMLVLLSLSIFETQAAPWCANYSSGLIVAGAFILFNSCWPPFRALAALAQQILQTCPTGAIRSRAGVIGGSISTDAKSIDACVESTEKDG